MKQEPVQALAEDISDDGTLRLCNVHYLKVIHLSSVLLLPKVLILNMEKLFYLCHIL